MEIVDFKNKEINVEVDENSNVVPEKFLIRKLIIAQHGFEADKIVHKNGSMTLSLDQIWDGFLPVVQIQGSMEIRKEFDWDKEKVEKLQKIPKSYLVLDIELSSTRYLNNALDLFHPNLETLSLDCFNPEFVFLEKIFPYIKSIPNVIVVVHGSTEDQLKDFRRSLDYISKSLKFSSIESLKFSINTSTNPGPVKIMKNILSKSTLKES